MAAGQLSPDPPPSGAVSSGAARRTGPRRAAVLGSPVAHSLSPALHRAAYAELGLVGWCYDAVAVREDGLAAFLDGLDPTWAGLSLTMPLKRTAVDLVDELDDVAATTRAVNTITWAPGAAGQPRRRLGSNTDVEGLVEALRPRLQRSAGGGAGAHADLRGAVLGGGATAVSAVVALARLGVSAPVVHVRSPARAAAVVEVADRLGLALELAGWDEAAGLLAADVVVSTAPAGATDALAARLARARPDGAALEDVPAGPLLLDVVYDPWPTPLARAWSGLGPVVDGFEMLVHQAVAQVRLMTGRAPSAEVLRAAGRTEREARSAQRG